MSTAPRVVVTGGTRGIGRATALRFARAGARLLVVHRTAGEDAESLARLLKEAGAEHLLVRADVTTGPGAASVADTARERWGGVDALVNNVGVDGSSPFQELSEEEWHRVMNHNATSAYLVTRALLGLLGEGASVVNIGASVALRGRPLAAHYSASKAALIGLTRSLSRELGPSGIRVNTVAPGVIETEPGASLPPPVAAKLAGMTSLGRLGTPEDVAAAVFFLAGDQAAFITGTTIEVDGGI